MSTYTYVDEFDVNEWETDPQDVRFNPDGTRMYVLGPMNDGTAGEFINEFALTCPFQISENVERKKLVVHVVLTETVHLLELQITEDQKLLMDFP